LPYHNPCWNTADGNTPISGKFSDGGLPCVPCPIDVNSRLPWKKKEGVNTSIGNEFCSIDAYEGMRYYIFQSVLILYLV
jgi:hypothetical protein